MQLIAFIISLHFIFFTARLLIRSYNPQIVLLASGIGMMVFAFFLNTTLPDQSSISGFAITDIFINVKESFLHAFNRIGFVIMIIGGFVSYMKRIGASDALVYISLQPLAIFQKHPYIAASLVIPIGQLLFIGIPSATGLGLLLVATIFPVLLGLGISRLSAVSVIVACTVFDLGPASVNTGLASGLLDKTSLSYFLNDQLPLTIPLTLIMMVLYYFTNKYFDKKEKTLTEPVKNNEIKPDVPLIYAVLPVLPLFILLISSPVFNLVPSAIRVDTSTAMIMTLFVALTFELVRTKRLKNTVNKVRYFWIGMGKMFSTVITLIVAADIFTKGLIGLGFMTRLLHSTDYLGFSEKGLGLVLAIIVFVLTILTGSGANSFYSISRFLKGIPIGQNTGLVLPMQISSGMGRAVSPISGVVVAASEIAGVSPLKLAKRNVFPLLVVFLILLVISYF